MRRYASIQDKKLGIKNNVFFKRKKQGKIIHRHWFAVIIILTMVVIAINMMLVYNFFNTLMLM